MHLTEVLFSVVDLHRADTAAGDAAGRIGQQGWRRVQPPDGHSRRRRVVVPARPAVVRRPGRVPRRGDRGPGARRRAVADRPSAAHHPDRRHADGHAAGISADLFGGLRRRRRHHQEPPQQSDRRPAVHGLIARVSGHRPSQGQNTATFNRSVH